MTDTKTNSPTIVATAEEQKAAIAAYMIEKGGLPAEVVEAVLAATTFSPVIKIS